MRRWQVRALAAYDDGGPRRDFLLTATPGAGKTTFALAVAARLLGRRVIDRVVVVCPTDHLRTQWADAADAAGIVLDPTMTNAQGPVPRRRSRLRHHLCAGRRPAGDPRGAQPAAAHTGDPGRDPPRRRRAVLGRGDR